LYLVNSEAVNFIKRTWHEAVRLVVRVAVSLIVRGRIADVGFWMTVAFLALDLFRHLPTNDDLTRLMIWVVLTKLNNLEQSAKHKPYYAPRLRRLEWADLTPIQQAWLREKKNLQPD